MDTIYVLVILEWYGYPSVMTKIPITVDPKFSSQDVDSETKCEGFQNPTSVVIKDNSLYYPTGYEKLSADELGG